MAASEAMRTSPHGPSLALLALPAYYRHFARFLHFMFHVYVSAIQPTFPYPCDARRIYVFRTRVTLTAR
jgi:hypothetical protein